MWGSPHYEQIPRHRGENFREYEDSAVNVRTGITMSHMGGFLYFPFLWCQTYLQYYSSMCQTVVSIFISQCLPQLQILKITWIIAFECLVCCCCFHIQYIKLLLSTGVPITICQCDQYSPTTDALSRLKSV